MTSPGGAEAGQWTFTRVLGLMDEQGRTGVLEVRWDDGYVRIHLRKGYIVAVTGEQGDRWLLGDYLVDSGTVGEEDLVAARRESVKRGVDVEQVLVDRGAITEDVLKRFVDLQTADRLFPLSRRKNLQLRFVEERPSPSRFGTPLPVSYVLREAERQAERWPSLRQRVGRASAVYEKDTAFMAEILGYEEPEDGDDPLPELGANARVAYFFIDGERTVEQVARAGGLTLFDCYAALDELLDAYLLTLVTTHGEGRVGRSEGSQIHRVVTVVTYALIAAILALGAQWVWQERARLRATASASSPRIDAVVRDARRHLVDRALQLHHLLRGRFPERLADLESEGLVSADVARVLDGLRYESTGDAYTLSWPPTGETP
ncbi:MAG: DUF4388 domain-containing protein [Myxococcota bacterium]